VWWATKYKSISDRFEKDPNDWYYPLMVDSEKKTHDKMGLNKLSTGGDFLYIILFYKLICYIEHVMLFPFS
jgi:hypothetical protein